MPTPASLLSAADPTSPALIHLVTAWDYLRLLALVGLCAGLAALVNRWGRLGRGHDDLIAAGRATLQLAVIGLLIVTVLESWWTTAAFVALMLTVASLTAGRRLVPRGAWWWAAVPVTVAAVPVGAILLGSGLIPLTQIAVVPVLGILIGNAMTATVLAGRRTLDALRSRRGEFEAGLSIGLLRRESALLVAREDASLALLPGIDQTRTVGLVTLPGAFVGTLLGGATPLEAAAVQLVVLAGLLLVQTLATLATLQLIARDRLR